MPLRLLSQHPKLSEWAPEPLVERQKDASDLVARVLPVLGTPAPMDTWSQALGFETAAEHPRWVALHWWGCPGQVAPSLQGY